MCRRRTRQVSQTGHFPASQPARPRAKCGGGVMDWRQSQDRAAAGLLSLSAGQLATVAALAEPRRHREMAQGVTLES